MTTPIVTLAEVRSFMSIRSDVAMPDVDNRINTLIMLASQQIETALDTELDYQQRTEFLNPSKSARQTYDFGSASDGVNDWGTVANPLAQSFWLATRNIDLTQPFQVWYDPTYQFDDTKLVGGPGCAGSYQLDSKRGKLTLRIMAWGREGSLKVSYTGGFAIDQVTGTLTTSAPPDIKMACIIQTVFLFTRIQPDNIGQDADRGGGKVSGGKFMTRGGITPEASNMLWQYKRMNTGRY